MAKKTKASKKASKGATKKKATKPKPSQLRKASLKMPVRPSPSAPKPTAKPAVSRSPAAPPAPKDRGALAARMAAFSQKVQDEEETPVAVRSWSEAKAEKPASKKLLPRTGEVTPAEEEEDEPEETEAEPAETSDDESRDEAPAGEAEEADEEEEEDEEPPRPISRPQMNPLSGPMAVPKDRELEFEVAPRHKIKKAGKGGERPEEFGPVELRQATASGGRHITRSLPENLQRAADRIQPLATPPEKTSGKKSSPAERFEVSMDKRAGPKLPDLSHWGDVEIGQQTLSGSRKVGTLTPQQQAEEKRREEEKKRAKK